jgi:hypothetical protein
MGVHYYRSNCVFKQTPGFRNPLKYSFITFEFSGHLKFRTYS